MRLLSVGRSPRAIAGRTDSPHQTCDCLLESLGPLGFRFFFTETAVTATNAHVARDETSMLAVLPNGMQLDAKVVYVDPDLDIALAKVEPPSANSLFPYLPSADATTFSRANRFWLSAVPKTPCSSA